MRAHDTSSKERNYWHKEKTETTMKYEQCSSNMDCCCSICQFANESLSWSNHQKASIDFSHGWEWEKKRCILKMILTPCVWRMVYGVWCMVYVWCFMWIYVEWWFWFLSRMVRACERGWMFIWFFISMLQSGSCFHHLNLFLLQI